MDKNEKHEVGSHIRSLRESRGYSLRVLAARSGLSVNAISRIERGENSPTVSSLHMLAKALKVPIAAFFAEDENGTAKFVDRNKRRCFRESGVLMECLGKGLMDQQMEPFVMTIDNQFNSKVNSILRSGEEFVYCLKGEIEFCVGKRLYQLKPGDSLLFKANQPHWCRKATKMPAKILVVLKATPGREISRPSRLEMHASTG